MNNFFFIIKFSVYNLSHFYLVLKTARMLCYCRLVYMPMSYLYGKRFVGPITPLILTLREELLTQPYERVDWKKVRHQCAKVRDSNIIFN
jgi:beta-amyrin synthase